MFAFYSFVYLNAHSVVIMPRVSCLLAKVAAIASGNLKHSFNRYHTQSYKCSAVQPNQAIELLSEINTSQPLLLVKITNGQ